MKMARRAPDWAVLTISYLCGAVPFSGLIAIEARGVDLRTVGTGTVSGTGLFRVAGLRYLLIGGALDVAKGTIGPFLAGPGRPALAWRAGSATVVGHNWSVFLNGAGGRGISPAMGSLLVNGWEGSLHLLAALAVGKLSKATSLGAFAGYVTLGEVLVRVGRPQGRRIAGWLIAPMLVKRILGNSPPTTKRIALIRLFFDQDTPQWPSWVGRVS